MSSVLLALVLSAWPLPRDAGPAEYADPANWPQEPEWNLAWPLFSFTPAGWSLGAGEQAAGVGMRVDRAWSISRGAPQVLLAVVAPQHDLSDPLVAGAWRLSPGELPDAGDLNGNGRLDVGDFAGDPSVADVNANGALDLEDLIAARSDGLDQDGNGRVDDLCGWDLSRDAPLVSTPDAGHEVWRRLAAPVGDGFPGIGLCSGCTLLPLVAHHASLPQALRLADDAGVRALLLPHSEAELSAGLELALTEVGSRVWLATEGSGGLTSFPLALHPAVISPRTLTSPASRTSAVARTGCGGASLSGTISVSIETCGQAATSLVGIAGLVFSAGPALTPAQVTGLLGGPRLDAERAVRLAEGALPEPITPATQLRPAGLSAAPSQAESCLLEGELGEPIACDGGTPSNPSLGALETDPSSAYVRLIERQGPYEWSTALPSPHPESRRRMLGVTELGPGSGPPRFVDLDGLGHDTVLVSSPRGLIGFTEVAETLSAPLSPGRTAPAFGDVDGDRVLDVVTAGDDGLLEASSFTAMPVPGFPRRLEAGVAGPPLITSTLEGTALVTLEVHGRLTHSVGSTAWSFELGAPQQSAPAAGLIDGDDYADLAIADGRELRVLLTDALAPRSASWSAPSRATQALLGDLTGDDELEIVAEKVFGARGEVLLTLDGWTVSVVPPALARIDRTSLRALLQVERRPDGLFELTRYDVERALRAGDSLGLRRVLRVFGHPPSRGGFAVADVTADREPDVLLPTEDGLLFIVDGEGNSPFDSPLPTLGSVLSAPAVGVARGQLEFAVRTTRGDLVRWLGSGLVEDITWESAGHDRRNTWNAQTPLPPRQLGGLGVTEPPVLQKPCGCSSLSGGALLGLVFLFRRHRRTC